MSSMTDSPAEIDELEPIAPSDVAYAGTFDDFVRTIGPRLQRSAFLLIGDVDLADDLVQTALAKVSLRWTSVAAKASRAAALLGMACAAQAQGTAASGAQVFRCPGPPVLYTDALSAQEARDRGCRTIEGAPITIVQSVRPRPAPPAASGATVAAASRPADARIDPAAQRARDADARRILGEELRKEEERLAELHKAYNNGEPERRADERNFQRYLDRVAEMKAGITRKEADIAALKRELAKLGP